MQSPRDLEPIIGKWYKISNLHIHRKAGAASPSFYIITLEDKNKTYTLFMPHDQDIGNLASIFSNQQSSPQQSIDHFILIEHGPIISLRSDTYIRPERDTRLLAYNSALELH